MKLAALEKYYIVLELFSLHFMLSTLFKRVPTGMRLIQIILLAILQASRNILRYKINTACFKENICLVTLSSTSSELYYTWVIRYWSQTRPSQNHTSIGSFLMDFYDAWHDFTQMIKLASTLKCSLVSKAHYFFSSAQ